MSILHTILQRNLNLKQREIFNRIFHWIATTEDHIHIFMTGCAGIGKSVL